MSLLTLVFILWPRLDQRIGQLLYLLDIEGNGGAIQMGLWIIMRLFLSGYNLVAYIIQRRCGYIFNVEGNLGLEY